MHVEQGQAARAVQRVDAAARRSAKRLPRSTTDRRCAAARWCRSWRTARCGTGARSTRLLGASPQSRSPIARAVRCWSRSRSTSSITRARRRSPSSTAPSMPRAALVRPGGEALRQRAAAALSARARCACRPQCKRILSRGGRISAGGSTASGGPSPRTGMEILAAGNARPPLTLRVNCARDDARGVAGGTSRSRRRRRIGGEPVRASSSIRHSPCTALPGSRRRVVLRAGSRRATVRHRCSTSRDGMRVLDACAAPGGKTTHLAGARRYRRSSRSTPIRARLRRVTRKSDATPARVAAMSTVIHGDAGAPYGLVGRRAVRPDPRRRAVQRVGRRSPASRRQVAAASSPTSRALRPRAGSRFWTRCGRCWRGGGSMLVCHLLGIRGGKRGPDRVDSWHGIRRRCAKPSRFRPMCRTPRQPTLAFAFGAQSTIRTGFSTRCSAKPDAAFGHRRARIGARRGTPIMAPRDSCARSAGMPYRPRFLDLLVRPCAAQSARGSLLALAMIAIWHSGAPARADIIPVKSPSSASKRAIVLLSGGVRTHAHAFASRRRCRRSIPLYFTDRIRACSARAGTGCRREGRRVVDRLSRARTTALTRTVPRSQRPARTDVRVARRGRSASSAASRRGRSARADALVEGRALRAAIRACRLDVNQLPKAVPGERARVARLAARVRMAPVRVSRHERPASRRGAVALDATRRRERWRRSRSSCSRRRRANTELFAGHYNTLLVLNGGARRAADARRRRGS